jgi:hypothetical protein
VVTIRKGDPMATVFQRVPVDEITVQARDVRFGRTVLTLVAAVLFSVGWIASKVLGGIWLALAWSATAVKVGWVEARSRSG